MLVTARSPSNAAQPARFARANLLKIALDPAQSGDVDLPTAGPATGNTAGLLPGLADGLPPAAASHFAHYQVAVGPEG